MKIQKKEILSIKQECLTHAKQQYEKYSNTLVKDLKNLHNQLAVFGNNDKQFYKLAVLDFRGNRFECNGEKITRWLTFTQGELFNFTDEIKFNSLYEEYKQNNISLNKRFLSKEKIFEWFIESDSRIGYVRGYDKELKKRAIKSRFEKFIVVNNKKEGKIQNVHIDDMDNIFVDVVYGQNDFGMNIAFDDLNFK